MLRFGRRKHKSNLPIIIEDARSRRGESQFKPRIQFVSTGQFVFYLILAGLWIFLTCVIAPLIRSHWPKTDDWASRIEIGFDVLGIGSVAILTQRRWQSISLTVISAIVALIMQQAFIGNIQAKDLSAATRMALKYCLQRLGEKEGE